MANSTEQPWVERDIDALRRCPNNLSDEVKPGRRAAAGELTDAVHRVAGHLADRHRTVMKVADAEASWSTHRWEPPAGADSAPARRSSGRSRLTAYGGVTMRPAALAIRADRVTSG